MANVLVSLIILIIFFLNPPDILPYVYMYVCVHVRVRVRVRASVRERERVRDLIIDAN